MSSYRSVLVAVDGSRDCYVALRHAADLAQDQNARLVVLTVAPPASRLNGIGTASVVPDQSGGFAHELQRAIAAVPPTVSVEGRLASGQVAERIIETASRCSCDLIVLGCSGHSGLRRLFRQPVCEAVLRNSPWPVLLVGAAVETLRS